MELGRHSDIYRFHVQGQHIQYIVTVYIVYLHVLRLKFTYLAVIDLRMHSLFSYNN